VLLQPEWQFCTQNSSKQNCENEFRTRNSSSGIARKNSARGTASAELRGGILHAEQLQTELQEGILHAEQPLQKMEREFRTRNGNYKKFAWNMASNIKKICETVKKYISLQALS